MPHQWDEHIQYCRYSVNKQSEERRAALLYVLHHSFVNTQSFQYELLQMLKRTGCIGDIAGVLALDIFPLFSLVF